MARPRASHEQQMQAYELHRAGFGPSAIRKNLADQYLATVVSLRTITTWVYHFKRLTPETMDLDSPFQWLRMDEYGLPWEAGEYLLGMWAYMNEYMARVIVELAQVPAPPSTVRQVIWWWRVHLAVPDATNHLDVYLWAEEFARFERVREVLGESVDLSGNEAYLAYGPWRGPDQLKRYQRALDEERILKPSKIRVDVPIEERIREAVAGRNPMHHAPAPSDDPKILPSKMFEDYLEMMRPTVAKMREGLAALLQREHPIEENDQ